MSLCQSHIVITDEDLRVNHEFVTTFEQMRKRYGHREMHDGALRDIAAETELDYKVLRTARHLRNALAHGEAVNRQALTRHLEILLAASEDESAPRVAQPQDQSLRRAYRAHGWLDPQLEAEMIANGFVSIGGDELGDLSGVDDPEDIRAMLTEAMPERTSRAIGIFVGYWRRFRLEAAPGDLVALPRRDRTVRVGEFVGPYAYVPHAQPRARHRRPVSWYSGPVARDAFDDDLEKVLKGRHSFQTFKAEDAAARLISLTRHSED